MVKSIKIEGGEVFEGTPEQLEDCFGLLPEDLDAWCKHYGWKYEIN